MGKHNFGYFFREGLNNMFSHGFMSFAAVGITVACLLIMGTFTLVAVNADALLKTLEQENEILVYVEETYTDSQTEALKKKLEENCLLEPNRSIRAVNAFYEMIGA